MVGAVAAAVVGSSEGVAGNLVTRGLDLVFGRLRSRIEITEPLPQAILKDQQPLGKEGKSFRVRGKLKRLPKDHKIWLLVEHEGVPGKIWPQGFFPVEYNPSSGEWEGRINPSNKRCIVHAVVAPPTSNDFFEFYRRANDGRPNWQPLTRIPVECVNRAAVQANKP